MDPFDPFAPDDSVIAPPASFDPFVDNSVRDPFSLSDASIGLLAEETVVSGQPRPAGNKLDSPFNPFDTAESSHRPNSVRRLSAKGRDLLSGVGGLSLDHDSLEDLSDEEGDDDEGSAFDPFKAEAAAAQNTGFKLENDQDVIGDDQYIATFPPHQKLGMLLQQGPFSTTTLVKRVFDGSIASQQQISEGSILVEVNGKDVQCESHSMHIKLISNAPRPLALKFRRGKPPKDEYSNWSGTILGRVSKHGESVSNLFGGVAEWQKRFFYFGGNMRSQLFIFDNKRDFEEWLAESHALHASFRSRVQPMHTVVLNAKNAQSKNTKGDEIMVVRKIKQKVYATYGSLFVFALDMKSATTGKMTMAKFASQDRDVIGNLRARMQAAVAGSAD
jgi:hypothetical protein